METPKDRRATAWALSRLGYETVACQSVRGAAAAPDGKSPDLIVSDFDPGAGPSGLEFLETARRGFPAERRDLVSGEKSPLETLPVRNTIPEDPVSRQEIETVIQNGIGSIFALLAVDSPFSTNPVRSGLIEALNFVNEILLTTSEIGRPTFAITNCKERASALAKVMDRAALNLSPILVDHAAKIWPQPGWGAKAPDTITFAMSQRRHV